MQTANIPSFGRAALRRHSGSITNAISSTVSLSAQVPGHSATYAALSSQSQPPPAGTWRGFLTELRPHEDDDYRHQKAVSVAPNSG